ncbi:hypothetical protein GCM10027290_42440 [Micromonospora sonneratiae]
MVRGVSKNVQSGAVQAVHLPDQIFVAEFGRIDPEQVHLFETDGLGAVPTRVAGIAQMVAVPLAEPLLRAGVNGHTRPGGGWKLVAVH